VRPTIQSANASAISGRSSPSSLVRVAERASARSSFQLAGTASLGIDAVARHRCPRAWALRAAQTSPLRSESGMRISCMPSQPLGFLIDDWSRGLSKHLPAQPTLFAASGSRACHHAAARPTLFATRPKSHLQPEAALWDVCNANLLRTQGDETIA
jgi:hypothetical protein